MNQKTTNTKKLVITALMCAFTCIATMIIKFQTPTFGYIHLGDGLVLMCGILLGPVGGALAAGIGSMFADLFSGYASFALATLIIKATTAWIIGMVFHTCQKKSNPSWHPVLRIIIGGVLAELFMTFGYFLFEALLSLVTSGAFTQTGLSAAFSSSAAGIPFNLVQGVTGIVICYVLYPILSSIPIIKQEYLHA